MTNSLKNSSRPLVSVVIPTRKVTDSIEKELIPACKKQSYKNFELVIVPDKLCPEGPASKRDLGAKNAQGTILAFIDDDAYPAKNWLKNALSHFQSNQVAAVCGPGITPLHDSLRQKVSGWVWSTWLGAGGAGIYRSTPQKKRSVDDYPTFNLLVRKKDFIKAGGFNSRFWPGEDTKLCHDLVYKLGKKIIYDPKVLVYHHRRPVFIPHLKQIGRFGLHRGYFVKIYPKTSARLEYFIPSLFLLWLVLIPLFPNLLPSFARLVYWLSLFTYFLLLFLTCFQVWQKEKNFKAALLLAPAIFLTHLVYGVVFIKGLLTLKLKQ